MAKISKWNKKDGFYAVDILIPEFVQNEEEFVENVQNDVFRMENDYFCEKIESLKNSIYKWEEKRTKDKDGKNWIELTAKIDKAEKTLADTEAEYKLFYEELKTFADVNADVNGYVCFGYGDSVTTAYSISMRLCRTAVIKYPAFETVGKAVLNYCRNYSGKEWTEERKNKVVNLRKAIEEYIQSLLSAHGYDSKVYINSRMMESITAVCTPVAKAKETKDFLVGTTTAQRKVPAVFNSVFTEILHRYGCELPEKKNTDKRSKIISAEF